MWLAAVRAATHKCQKKVGKWSPKIKRNKQTHEKERLHMTPHSARQNKTNKQKKKKIPPHHHHTVCSGRSVLSSFTHDSPFCEAQCRDTSLRAAPINQSAHDGAVAIPCEYRKQHDGKTKNTTNSLEMRIKPGMKKKNEEEEERIEVINFRVHETPIGHTPRARTTSRSSVW